MSSASNENVCRISRRYSQEEVDKSRSPEQNPAEDGDWKWAGFEHLELDELNAAGEI